MALPHDYLEHIYAGVLGKIIGVYLGRPFEGWTYEKIMAELGEVWYYVHEKQGVPLIVTDDDISGTFTFLRALPDFGNDREITPAQIGQTWLNYLIENRTVLWWGGMGNSTEHTAYLRLKSGISAPASGSIATNGKVVAEQIGAQIFIDGWAMVAPGDPALAADLARRAASVSHDGEAIYGAQVLAAMESAAFLERDTNKLLDIGVSFIPKDSIIYRLIADLREWHEQIPDWRETRIRIAQQYGYDRYGGNCHIVPNHALIMLGLLYGEDDFQKTLMITNTAGWDTDCNSGNIGCLMGIKNGLVGIDFGPDWRGPLADRLYLPTADGGSCITDAAQVAVRIANSGRAFFGLPPLHPKGGARFHFELPGSLQGFQAEPLVGGLSPARLENVSGHSRHGRRSLAIHYDHTATGQAARAATPTFLSPDALEMRGYSLFACPTLYPGQVVSAEVLADSGNLQPTFCRLYLRRYAAGNRLERVYGPEVTLLAGELHHFQWKIPQVGGWPVAEIGIEVNSPRGAPGTLYLDSLAWGGAPDTVFTRPEHAGDAWRYSWVNALDEFVFDSESFRVIQNTGTGLLIHGTTDWDNYRVEVDVTPHMVKSAGIAARVQGLQRYYALLLAAGGKIRLVKVWYGTTVVLAEADFAWAAGHTCQLGLEVKGEQLTGWVDGIELLSAIDNDSALLSGAVALVVEEGRSATHRVTIRPV
jgi:ADP-ribosylglycohydrolase